ncbi:hypothetical protein HG531_010929 [Fusarium graminearum]|nr:hypothetical protein HG531_010929 [Fusarium graminearum]
MGDRSYVCLDSEGELDTDIDVTGYRHVINGEDLKTRVVDELVSLLDVGTLETGNDGDLEVQTLDGLDKTSGDGITSNDTTKDVDKDGSDLGVAGDELESLLDGGRGGTTTNVEEVGGLATVQLDDVHGGHGKTSTVDEAADITVKLDEVEVGLGSADLIGVLLSGVAPLKDLLLSEVGVVVKAELGVHAEDLMVRGLRQGVDLNLGGVLLAEDLVELLDGVLGVLDALLAEAELGGDLAGSLVSDTDIDVDVVGVDGVGGVLGNGLNVHTTLGRRDNDGALVLTVHKDGEVELTTSKLALADVDRVAETAASTRLLGNKLVADHLLGEHLSLVGRVDDTDTTLKTVVEGTLSSATGKDLSLDNHIIVANLLSDLLGLLGGLCDGTLGNTNTVLLERIVIASKPIKQGKLDLIDNG